ncbi:hypothetical protein DERP_010648 [Dermatophagoides pteronyssinus]|uniref:Uncharacterized protein n=1 Tax=Dermatophagoides pteronyssinus TaxID=6956 RepID=A0ABQ8JA20_DERPT|nr:hypothetical protein DERP_010648 [Dermatophagoides pteronyssinus]
MSIKSNFQNYLSQIERLHSLQTVAHGPQNVKRVFKHVKQIFPFSKSFFNDFVTPRDSISAFVNTELNKSPKQKKNIPVEKCNGVTLAENEYCFVDVGRNRCSC